MKPEIHPEYHPVIFVDDEHEIITRSTMTSGETRDIDGVDHYIVRVDISAFTHPFYTGKVKVLDTEGRVERFKKRYAKRGSAAKKAAAEAPAMQDAPADDSSEA